MAIFDHPLFRKIEFQRWRRKGLFVQPSTKEVDEVVEQLAKEGLELLQDASPAEIAELDEGFDEARSQVNTRPPLYVVPSDE